MATAAEVVTAIKAAIESSPGVKEITVDGIRVRTDLPGALNYWEKRAAREASYLNCPVVASIDLSGGMEE